MTLSQKNGVAVRAALGVALACLLARSLSSCTSARAAEAPPGIVPASYLQPVNRSSRGESCDGPHPLNADGSKAHDWMVGGDGIWKCWFCDVVKRN